MERTVPYTASEEVELYLRTYYSLLRTTDAVQIRSLEEAHSGMNSLLHQQARDRNPDMSAFIYALLRLPDCIWKTDEVILGQSASVFREAGIGNVWSWEQVSAKARRRRCFYHPDRKRLACIIASRSDIDDVIPLLTAYQIEWNKLHSLLQHLPEDTNLKEAHRDRASWYNLAEGLMMSVGDLTRWRAIFGDRFLEQITRIKQTQKYFQVRLLNGTLIEYNRATNAWWQHIADQDPPLTERPIYFVSSNPHSLANLLSGFALRNQKEIEEYLQEHQQQELLDEWTQIKAQKVPSSEENFWYYALKKYLQDPSTGKMTQRRNADEQKCGIKRIDSEHFFDVDAQIFHLSELNPTWMDPRIRGDREDLRYLQESEAVIVNIDYPLGLSAYNILTEVAANVGKVLGVYSLGKAATLNGVVGDVMIPYVVHDEHSRNTYLCPRAFEARDVAPYLTYGTVLDNQKAVTVRGTSREIR